MKMEFIYAMMKIPLELHHRYIIEFSQENYKIQQTTYLKTQFK
jgi:hypothetical protein